MENMSDFKLIDRKISQCILSMPEDKHFFRILPQWIGYNAEKTEFEVCEREYGASKWNTKKLFKYAVDNISSFSDIPYKITSVISYVLLILCLLTALIIKSTPMIILTILLILSFSFTFATISFYAARSFDELKCRPKYIIDKTVGKE